MPNYARFDGLDDFETFYREEIAPVLRVVFRYAVATTSPVATAGKKALGALAVAARDILASLGYWPAQATT